MDFARQQRDPKRHLVGIGFVVLVHALVVYALLTGLARQAVEVIKKPLTATIIQEIKPPPPPPPPPPKRIVEAPPVKPPPQPYVPPPDIPPPTPPQEAPVITSVAPTPPTEPFVIAPPAPPVVIEAPPAPPAPAPKPAVRRGITPIKREDPVYPRSAIRAGIEKGQVVAQLQIDEGGNVTDVKIVSANPARHFDSAVKDALINWKFAPDGTKYTGIIEVNFTLKE
ncbi:MAG: energy transducer TonB [Betaproteobacteria bacterium]